MNTDHRSRGRPRQKLPSIEALMEILERLRGKPWKVIEFKIGVDRCTIRRRLAEGGKVFLNTQQ